MTARAGRLPLPRRLAVFISILLVCASSASGGIVEPHAVVLPASARQAVEQAEIQALPVRQFKIGSEIHRFGSLEFVGGLELTSNAPDFGAISAFRFLEPGSDFIAVADTGFWSFGTVTRDDEMRPTGFANYTLQQFAGPSGNPIIKKWQVDAEGMAVRDGIATVGLEREHRIVQYRIEPGHMRDAFRAIDFLVPRRELRMNRGFETVAYAPGDGPLHGALVVVSEKSLDANGDIFAAVLDGPGKGIFTVKRNDPFDITDGAFLPDGDLLLLERSFSVARGVGMRLRRIPGRLITGGTRAADGPVVLQADMSYQIDNMEAMDVWQRSDGATVVSLMSDDNHSMLQRNLYLEFRLID